MVEEDSNLNSPLTLVDDNILYYLFNIVYNFRLNTAKHFQGNGSFIGFDDTCVLLNCYIYNSTTTDIVHGLEALFFIEQ